MDAGRRTINEIFNGSKILEVPFFQRAYVWSEPNWERFLEDVEYVCSSKDTYFMGSLILKQKPTSSGSNVGDIRLVIDGQQRLTTISILLKVLSLKTGAWKKFEKRFMLDDDVGGGPVLNHNRNDLPAFNQIMSLDKLEDLKNEDKITEAYRYFAKNADPEKLDFETILNKILFVGIDLDQDDDEQQIFDTINSLGVVLSTAELLKNYFFSRKDIKSYTEDWYDVFEKDEETRKYWDTDITTGRTKRTFIDVFFYSFLLLKLQDSNYTLSADEKIKLSKFERLFESYKYFIKNKCNDDRIGILKEIKEYAIIFRKAINKNVIREELTAEPGIERINDIIFQFDTTTIIPYVLYIEKNVKDKAERNHLYDILEAYITRRIITRATTKNYNRLFGERLILNQVLSRKAFVEYMQESEDINNRIPSDSNLRKAFHESVLLNSYATGVLYLIESRIRNKSKQATALLGIDRYSLEHMMPKKWRNNWDMPADPGNRDETLLTLGNLAIITSSLNASIRDANWKTKKQGSGTRDGLLKYAVGLETLSDFLKLDEWNEDHIYERAEWLYEHAADIWHIEGLLDDEAMSMEASQETADQSNQEKGTINHDLSETKDQGEKESSIHGLRRKYWDLALKHIKELQGSNSPFKNVYTSKEYWMNGYIGMRGFHISCEAKMNRAAVLLILGSSKRDRNKAAFDFLYARKEEIEKALGTEVDWWRFENGKSAYVNIDCKVQPIGIYAENNWEKMAQFHAEWTKKFNDVIVPLLQEWYEAQS